MPFNDQGGQASENLTVVWVSSGQRERQRQRQRQRQREKLHRVRMYKEWPQPSPLSRQLPCDHAVISLKETGRGKELIPCNCNSPHPFITSFSPLCLLLTVLLSRLSTILLIFFLTPFFFSLPVCHTDFRHTSRGGQNLQRSTICPFLCIDLFHRSTCVCLCVPGHGCTRAHRTVCRQGSTTSRLQWLPFNCFDSHS